MSQDGADLSVESSEYTFWSFEAHLATAILTCQLVNRLL
jgi:hypothetical protein